MANFTKGDLYYKDYDWKASDGDNKNIVGFPDNVLLNRHEGYEVLHFLNRYMSTKNWNNQSTLHRLEQAIRNRLPSTTRSHKNVREWLDSNFTL